MGSKINPRKILKISTVVFTSFALYFTVVVCGCVNSTNQMTLSNVSTEAPTGMKSYDGYELVQETVLSRHNIRAAELSVQPAYTEITPHEWINWTANVGELSQQGCEEENLMGQYFRLYLEKENLIPHNWIPTGNEAYFFANSVQRTIATAQNFATGMLPVANSKINHNFPLGQNDPVFKKWLSKQGSTTKEKIVDEISSLGNGRGLLGIGEQLADNIKIAEKVLDFSESEYAKKNNKSELTIGDINVTFKEGKRAIVDGGDINIASSAVDALKLQYYMTLDDKAAAFGHDISYSDWEKLGEIEDLCLKMVCGTYTESIDLSHPMLQELLKCMQDSTRKFTFICGHDTTIIPLNFSLKAKDYALPNAISKLCPIGSKLVINKWKNDDGQLFYSMSMVYASVDQLRNHSILSLENPPMEYQLELDGLNKNIDGLYPQADFENRFKESIAAYDALE